MAQTRTTEELAAMTYLLQRGIETPPVRLNEMLKHAIRELEAYPSLEPAAALTEAEVEALRAGGLEPRGTRPVPDLVAWGRVRYAALLQKSLTPEEAAQRLGVTAGRVRQLLAERRLLGVQLEGRWRIPEFQFVPVPENETQRSPADRGAGAVYRILPGLDRVLAAIPEGIHLLTLHGWLTTPKRDLAVDDLGTDRPQELSPLAWLEQGRPPERVVALAESLGY
jgi:excisionase family DNA binding protein